MNEPCAEDINKSSRLGECEVCGNENALYKCPRCEVKTCSLDCVKIHKKELECDGDRDKTAFVPMCKFDNLNVLSDYRFLEDVSRTVDSCKRNPLKRSTRFKRPLPIHLSRLRREAMTRRTKLEFLPQHFTRHKENTTILNFDTNVIHWKLEFIFPQGNNIKVAEDRCDENTRLSTVLSKYIEFDTCPSIYKNHLQFYHAKGCAGIEVLLQAEHINPSPSFFVLDIHDTLKENFENRIIIENPIIYVIDKDHKDEYHLLDPDLKVNIEAGNKNHKKFLREFTPFTFFDTVNYSKRDPYSKSVDSIHSSAQELKKYFGFEDDDSDENLEEKKNKGNKRKFIKFKNFKNRNNSKKALNIPQYDDLVKNQV